MADRRLSTEPGVVAPRQGGQIDVLKAYAGRRLELGDLIRGALHLAQSSRDEQAEGRARDLLARLAAGTFRLAVVGQFSRGKSTLMNALLGGPYLPRWKP